MLLEEGFVQFSLKVDIIGKQSEWTVAFRSQGQKQEGPVSPQLQCTALEVEGKSLRDLLTSVPSTEPIPGLTTRSRTVHLGWQLSRRRGSQQVSLGTSKNEPSKNCQAELKDEA